MSEYESLLIERIDARQLVRKLTPRQREFLVRYYRYGDTLKEMGERYDLSGGRCQQIVADAERRLRGWWRRRMEREPYRFDPEAFRRHQEKLAELRAKKAEHEAIMQARILSIMREERQPAPRPSALPPEPVPAYERAYEAWKAKLAVDRLRDQLIAASRGKPYVEPWFNPDMPANAVDLAEITAYARQYLRGDTWCRGHTETVACPRNADAVATIMLGYRRRIPSASAVWVRCTSAVGDSITLDITWD